MWGGRRSAALGGWADADADLGLGWGGSCSVLFLRGVMSPRYAFVS
jgi:hypothetical protein